MFRELLKSKVPNVSDSEINELMEKLNAVYEEGKKKTERTSEED